MTAMLIFRKGLLALIFGSVSSDVMANAQIYFLFTALSYPFLGLRNAGAAIFRAMGNSKISMSASLIMNFINLCGNALLIFVFNMGAAGAAIATLFSRIVGAVMIMFLVYDKNLPVHIEKLFSYKPDFQIIKRICGIGIPHGAEKGMFQFGKVITQSLISAMGTISIAANDVKYTLIISVISMWICRVGLSYIFGKYMGMGVMGVWIAMMCDWLVRALFFGTRLVRGTWLKKYKALEVK